MKQRYLKTAADRSAYLTRKLDEYRARIIVDPEYDRWYWRRYRLLSYRNHVFKWTNREISAEVRRRLRNEAR